MHPFCVYLDWSGMTPEAWAAWSQVLLAAATVALAIYVPMRMQRLAELDRMLVPLEVFEALLDQGELYLKRICSSTNTQQLDFYDDEYSALLDAAKRSLQEDGLPPRVITELAVAFRYATTIGLEWKQQTQMCVFISTDPNILGRAQRRVAKVYDCLRQSSGAVTAWKGRHPLTLCFASAEPLKRIELRPLPDHAAT